MNTPKIAIESLLKPHWSDDDVAKVKTVLNFVQSLMNEHDFTKISTQYQHAPYKQHNRNMADNIGGVIETLTQLVKHSPEFSYDVKRVFVDGEQVIVHSHATLKAAHRGNDTKGMNIIDTWRVVDGKLVEHWDAVQALDISMRIYSLLTGGKIKNTNGVF